MGMNKVERLSEGPMDFVRGAARETGRKVANSAPVRAAGDVVRAGQTASAAGELEKLVHAYAKLINATTPQQQPAQAQQATQQPAQAQQQAQRPAQQPANREQGRATASAQPPRAMQSTSKPKGKIGPLGKDDFRWTFDSFLQATHGERVDEGLWDFMGGIKNAVVGKVRDKIEKYGDQPSVLKDIYHAGKDASAAGDARKDQARQAQMQQKTQQVEQQIKAMAEKMGPQSANVIKAAIVKLPRHIQAAVASKLGV